MIHYASFRYYGENFIAIGEREYRLSVYVENSPGQYYNAGDLLCGMVLLHRRSPYSRSDTSAESDIPESVRGRATTTSHSVPDPNAVGFYNGSTVVHERGQ